MLHPREKSSCWTVTPAGHLPALPELGKGPAGRSGTCKMMPTKLRALTWHFFFAWSHRHPSPGFFLFSLVLEICCFHYNFYSLGDHPSCSPCYTVRLFMTIPLPQPQPLATDVGRCAKPKQVQHHVPLNIVICPGGHLTQQAQSFSGLYIHTRRGSLPFTDSPS